MEGLFLRVTAVSLACSAVMLPVLLLSRRLCHRYAAHTCYYLWLLLALRLVLPFQLTVPEPVVTVRPPSYEVSVKLPPSSQSGAAAVPEVPVQSGAQVRPAAALESERRVPVTQILAAAWTAGMAAFLLWQGSAYVLLRRSLLRRAKAADEWENAVLRRQQRELELRRPVELRRAAGVSSPMVLGLLRPVVLLPERAVEEDALEMVLRHELVHLRRWDVAYKALFLLANAVHWFNPLVWWMVREGGRNLELCCDDEVVRGKDGQFRRRYGEVLLRTAAAGRAPALSSRFGSGKRQLKGRLGNLFQHKKNSAALIGIILAATLLAGALVVCEAAGNGRISETEAIDRLEQSIAYDAQSGVLSFTIPDADTPSQPWRLQISGRAEFEDSMSASLHYHTDTQWEPGQTYTENLKEIADSLRELFIHVTLGVTERPIDLLPYIRSGAVSQGDTDRTPEGEAVGKLVQSIEYLDGDLWFTIPDYGRAEDWRIRITGKDAGGSSHSQSADHDYHYLEGEILEPGVTYAMNIPPADWTQLAQLTLRVWLGEAYQGVELLPYAQIPRSGCYSMEPPADGGSAGSWAPVLMLDGTQRTFTLNSDPLSSYLARGRYTVEGGVVECATDDGRYRYVFESADGNTLRFDQGRSSQIISIDPEFAVPAYDGALFRWTGELPRPEEPSVYVNNAYGFVLQLPESWAGHWRAEEVDDESGDFYGQTAFYCTAVNGERGALVGELGVWPEEKTELLGRERLLGHQEGRWVYLYYPQTDMPALAQASEAQRDIYDRMYDDLRDIPEHALSFTARIFLGTAAVQSAGTDGYRAVLLGEERFYDPAAGRWLEIGEMARVITDDEDILSVYNEGAASFTAADLDQDGRLEVILQLGIADGFVILRQREGKVWGYGAFQRWIMPVKADGTTYYSGGAGNWGWGHITFGEKAFEYDRLNYCESGGGQNAARYVVNGEAAARAEFDAAAEEALALPDAQWYPLTPENVASAFP